MMFHFSGSTLACLLVCQFTVASARNPFDDNADSTPGKGNGRRVGQLGKSTSPTASSADCAQGLDIQLFDDEPSVNFRANPSSCRSGKTFVGTSADGKKTINLVPGGTKGVAGKKTFAASVTDDETGQVFSIGADANGDMFVVERLQEDYGEELDPVDRMGEGERRALEEERQRPSGVGSVRGSAVDGNHHRSLQATTLDVLVPWTGNAECRNSGLALRGCTLTGQTDTNMRNRINLAIQETNTAYASSGVNAQLNLVHAYRTPTYREARSNAFSKALSAIRSKTDGNMDEVHGYRTQYGADIVALIIDDSQYCGIGYLGPSSSSMFSATAWNCATGYFSFGHEIGHNLGCNHDKGTSGVCSTNNFNYGWRDPQAGFRSILAYNCGNKLCSNLGEVNNGGCTRVQRFSNDEFLYNGKAIGSAIVDNARHINSVVDSVAGYFSSGTNPPTAPPSPPPTLAPTNPPPTNSPTPPPTNAPTNPPEPTNNPTPPPTNAPTNPPEPTNNPTPPPTNAPTTGQPTPLPTPMPTVDCTGIDDKKICESAGCGWNNRYKQCSNP
mmetsp:Transcript_32782/g.57231  ORF Transcript_32782/g.57231 Transcript_32782/m.57231 type:complete len:556 (+) Transcript_32782:3-1670(+)